MSQGQPVELLGGGLAATLLGGPQLTIASLRHGPRELLVSPEELPPAYRVHGRRAGITLLHPWANRLGSDEFDAGGRRVRVAPDDPLAARDANGLPIHGLAHPDGWRWTALGPASAQAVAAWPALPAFPFGHEVEVTVELAPVREIVVTTTVSAGHREPWLPVSFGWHPYFRAARGPLTCLALPLRRRLELDDRGLPTCATEAEAPGTMTLEARGLDDGFADLLDGSGFSLRTPERVIAVCHETGFTHAQVFAPLDAEVVSLEPMTAPTDALRSGRDLRSARPGESFTARFRIAVGAGTGAGGDLAG